MQRSHAGCQFGIVAELIKLRGWAGQRSLCAVTAGPADMDIGLLAVALHGDRDALDELARDGLAIGRGGGDGMPERWNISGQPADRLALLSRKAAGVLGRKAFVVSSFRSGARHGTCR